MELAWIERLRGKSGMELLGDDAAVWGGKVLTVDMLTEGVDFIVGEVEAEFIGRKSIAVNLSDVAAMGAVPEVVLVAVSLPCGDSGENLLLAEKLYAGMEPLLQKYNVKIIGGDTNCWNGGLVISVTAIGSVLPQGVFKRAGAKAGDAILVTGELGGSILSHQFLFEPRIFEAIYLNENYSIHAAIDISDGLAIDLHRVAKESNLGATLYANSIPISHDAFVCAKESGRSAIDHALSDGEDFELILAVSDDDATKLIKSQPLLNRFGCKLYNIGNFTADKNMQIISENGIAEKLEPLGFQHK
jgi:thiamine-monophosphate kinase